MGFGFDSGSGSGSDLGSFQARGWSSYLISVLVEFLDGYGAEGSYGVWSSECQT